MKKILALALVLMMIATMFAACGETKVVTPPATPDPATPADQPKDPVATPDTPAVAEGKVVVWSFTDELQKMVDGYVKNDLPKLEIEFVMAPSEVYQSKIKPVLQSGQDAPDVFTLESAFVKGFVDTGWMLDLSDMKAKADAAGVLPYTYEVTTDKSGAIRGYSWQGTPGAMFYRRSIAKQYLGTDEPAKVQEMVKDVDAFLATAQKLYDGSGGSVRMVTGGDLMNPFKAGRAQSWVVDGKFVLDPLMLDMVDLQKTLKDKKLDNGANQWDASWFACMNDTYKDEKGNSIKTFSYFLPTWGLHYVLKTNCEQKDGDKVISTTAGDWGMVKGPFSYFWGGTWVGAYVNTPNVDQSKALIEYLTMNEKFLEAWAKDTGDFVSSMNVVNRIKDTYSEPFLAGQNHYAEFATMAPAINGSILTGYDQDIEKIFTDNMALYIKGEKTKEETIQTIKEAVATQFPEVTVE